MAKFNPYLLLWQLLGPIVLLLVGLILVGVAAVFLFGLDPVGWFTDWLESFFTDLLF